MAIKPLVALVGRPNVGKSTLFNRLAGERLAIVEDIPGTTRDRLYTDTEWIGKPFTVIDTGGLVLGTDIDDLTAQIRHQAQQAMDEADVIVFITEAIQGLVPADQDTAHLLRQSAKPVLPTVNKADNAERRMQAVEFYELGLGDPYPISALHGTGTGDLLDAVVAAFPAEEEEPEDERVKIAIVGRPNVGKSSLLNRLLGRERTIVSEIPGTTRDAIDTVLEWEGEELILIDTAGIRRRGRVERGIEQYSVLRALKAMQRADVILLLIDAIDGPTAQDAHVAGYALQSNKSIVVLVNKWDAIEKDEGTMLAYTQRVRVALRFLDYVPVLFISARTGQRVDKVLPTALQVYEARFIRIPTSELNGIIQNPVAQHAPPSKAGKRLKFYYGTQASVDPPHFVFFVNDVRLVHFSYERYLENQVREQYSFSGTPLRLTFRNRK